jgi:hypothetical protein
MTALREAFAGMTKVGTLETRSNMANKHRGEIEAELGGETYILCLTLGALAELESAYGDQDLIAIAERFETGRIGAGDAIKIIGAGLRGGGAKISNEAVSALQVAGGAAGYIGIVAKLLTATFASPETP